jgi:hypothetical protein
MDVGGWLRNLGLAKYEAVFRDHQVLRHLRREISRTQEVTVAGLLQNLIQWQPLPPFGQCEFQQLHPKQTPRG